MGFNDTMQVQCLSPLCRARIAADGGAKGVYPWRLPKSSLRGKDFDRMIGIRAIEEILSGQKVHGDDFVLGAAEYRELGLTDREDPCVQSLVSSNQFIHVFIYMLLAGMLKLSHLLCEQYLCRRERRSWCIRT